MNLIDTNWIGRTNLCFLACDTMNLIDRNWIVRTNLHLLACDTMNLIDRNWIVRTKLHLLACDTMNLIDRNWIVRTNLHLLLWRLLCAFLCWSDSNIFNYNWQNASGSGVGTTCVNSYFQVYQHGGFDMETALVIISLVILVILYDGKNLWKHAVIKDFFNKVGNSLATV